MANNRDRLHAEDEDEPGGCKEASTDTVHAADSEAEAATSDTVPRNPRRPVKPGRPTPLLRVVRNFLNSEIQQLRPRYSSPRRLISRDRSRGCLLGGIRNDRDAAAATVPTCSAGPSTRLVRPTARCSAGIAWRGELLDVGVRTRTAVEVS